MYFLEVIRIILSPCYQKYKGCGGGGGGGIKITPLLIFLFFFNNFP